MTMSSPYSLLSNITLSPYPSILFIFKFAHTLSVAEILIAKAQEEKKNWKHYPSIRNKQCNLTRSYRSDLLGYIYLVSADNLGKCHLAPKDNRYRN